MNVEGAKAMRAALLNADLYWSRHEEAATQD